MDFQFQTLGNPVELVDTGAFDKYQFVMETLHHLRFQEIIGSLEEVFLGNVKTFLLG